MSRVRRWVRFSLVGGLAYWVPDMLIHWVNPPHRIWITLLTFVVPAIVIFVWFFLARKAEYHEHRRSLAWLMLIGVWVFGPLGIAIGGATLGGTFLSPENITQFYILWSMFPATTFMMSTYSGSLGGVLLVTILLCITASLARNLKPGF